jgi:hypothetical protein
VLAVVLVQMEIILFFLLLPQLVVVEVLVILEQLRAMVALVALVLTQKELLEQELHLQFKVTMVA